ncbi:MAG: NUDIX domain-containing protein [Bacteroidetes bacterium]|nr:NUDIX domain-containing protein [Bacteroidota bacterium]
MTIFLNERVIRFVPDYPEKALSTDLITKYSSVSEFRQVWLDFQRNGKFDTLIIIDNNASEKFYNAGVIISVNELSEFSVAFKTFLSFFKYVPAAGGLVKNEKSEYLFIYRLGFWDLPKGKIEKKDFYDNNLENVSRRAALREVMEETGLERVEIVRQLPCTWHIYEHKSKQALKQTFWYEMAASSQLSLIPQTSEGIYLVKWISPENLPSILAHTYRSLSELLYPLVL